MIGSKHLIAPDYVETRPGQAHFVVPGATRTCRECVFWDGKGYDPWGKLRSARCLKAQSLILGGRIRNIPHNALECRYFEIQPFPLKAVDRSKAWK